jgi:hypothetical protein
MQNTHKQICKDYCSKYLQERGAGYYFNEQHFNHIYRKFNGANGNAWMIGLMAADFIICNSEPVAEDEAVYN